ncbi:MAG TPA: alpha/beta fold hydrolase [Jatrophihabitans sp.]|uniref:thioesterase II family protein n=1 Tax=Jatrophihabitans sp. TaxID=1932789 RepID=UPI002F20C5E9
MTRAAQQTSRWLPLHAFPDLGGLPLFCLPHAGGGASAYRAWLGRLPGVDVLPVQPPGREARLRDAPYEQMAPLAADLAGVITEAAAGRPFAVYGHSLGALVAFETLREIRRRGGEQPVQLFVSGCVAPHCPIEDGPPVTGMTQPQLVQMLRQLGGTPDWLLADPEVLQMILPAVRADFSVKETYSYQPEPPLDVPVTVLSSTADPRAPHEWQQRWHEQTSAGFALHTLPGGHFAVFERSEVALGHVAGALRGWL